MSDQEPDVTQPAVTEPVLGRPAILSMQDIAKVYGTDAGEVHALRGVSFDIDPGDYVAIMGPSGRGSRR